jgi:hypothetical protein
MGQPDYEGRSWIYGNGGTVNTSSSSRESVLKMTLTSCRMIVIAAVALTVYYPGYCFLQLSKRYPKTLSATSSGGSVEGQERSEKVLPGKGIIPVTFGLG